MLSSRDFITSNEKLINQEVDAILDSIDERLFEGYCTVNWVLRYAPAGAAQYIASVVNRKMEAKGWFLETEVDYSRRLLSLKAYPDLSSLHAVQLAAIK